MVYLSKRDSGFNQVSIPDFRLGTGLINFRGGCGETSVYGENILQGLERQTRTLCWFIMKKSVYGQVH